MAVFYAPPGSVTVTFTTASGSSTINYIKFYPAQKGTDMSDQHARMRVTLDLPVDPSTASPRVLKALANEARDYVQVVLVKDREITLTDHVEVIDVHVHNSPSPAEACDACVRELALDGRS